MGAERSPRKKRKKKEKEKTSHPLLARCPSLSVAVIGARYPVQKRLTGHTKQKNAGCGAAGLCVSRAVFNQVAKAYKKA